MINIGIISSLEHIGITVDTGHSYDFILFNNLKGDSVTTKLRKTKKSTPLENLQHVKVNHVIRPDLFLETDAESERLKVTSYYAMAAYVIEEIMELYGKDVNITVEGPMYIARGKRAVTNIGQNFIFRSALYNAFPGRVTTTEYVGSRRGSEPITLKGKLNNFVNSDDPLLVTNTLREYCEKSYLKMRGQRRAIDLLVTSYFLINS